MIKLTIENIQDAYNMVREADQRRLTDIYNIWLGDKGLTKNQKKLIELIQDKYGFNAVVTFEQ